MKTKSITMAFLAVSAIATTSSEAVTLANWTFESSVPTTAGPHAAEAGILAASSFASSNTGGTFSNPAGWGSLESFSSNNWNVTEYFQFSLNTLSYENVSLSWQQTGSGTGPTNFDLTYSTNGTDFTLFSSYTVTDDGWNTTATPAASEKSFDLSAVTALDNQSTVFFRLVNTTTASINGGTVGTSGTGRVDNFTVNADLAGNPPPVAPIPEPSTALLGAIGALMLLRRRR